MANFKKEDKASILARLNVLEKKMEDVDKIMSRNRAVVLETYQAIGANASMPVPSITGVLDGGVTVVQAPSPTPKAEVKHRCETTDCGSMDTKEYQGVEMKMWLCETHKF